MIAVDALGWKLKINANQMEKNVLYYGISRQRNMPGKIHQISRTRRDRFNTSTVKEESPSSRRTCWDIHLPHRLNYYRAVASPLYVDLWSSKICTSSSFASKVVERNSAIALIYSNVFCILLFNGNPLCKGLNSKKYISLVTGNLPIVFAALKLINQKHHTQLLWLGTF